MKKGKKGGRDQQRERSGSDCWENSRELSNLRFKGLRFLKPGHVALSAVKESCLLWLTQSWKTAWFPGHLVSKAFPEYIMQEAGKGWGAHLPNAQKSDSSGTQDLREDQKVPPADAPPAGCSST